MKFDKKQVYYIVLAFVLCYALQDYWADGAKIVHTIYIAALPFIVGAAIAYVVNIVMSIYEKIIVRFVKWAPMMTFKRAISMPLAYLTFIFLIVWLFSIVLPDLISSINSLLMIDTSGITDFITELSKNNHVKELLKYFGDNSDLSSTITSYSQQLLKQFLTMLTNILTSVTSIASTVINIFISFVFSLYVLASKEKLKHQFTLVIDTYTGKYAKTIHYVLAILNSRFHGFFVGQTLEATILGTLTAIGMVLFKFPYASTVGVLIAFTALIPVVGAYIGVTIGFILIATQSVNQAIWFVVFLVVLQQFEGNIIYPRVVGGSINLPGMWVLLSITVGGSLWGIVGMLIAVPLAASLYQMLKDNIAHHQAKKLIKKE